MIIISTIVDKNSFKEMSNPYSQKKTLKCSTWVQSQKRQNDLVSKAKVNITIIQVYTPNTNAKEAEVDRVYEDLQDLIATAAAKSLQSCPTQCDLIDGSPPGSAVPGILQARILEWVAISFSNA